MRYRIFSKKREVESSVQKNLSIMSRLDSLYRLANKSLGSYAKDCDKESLFNDLFRDIDFPKEDKETQFVKLHTFNWEKKEPYLSFLGKVVKESVEHSTKLEAVGRIVELMGDEAPTKLKELVKEHPLIEQMNYLRNPALLMSHLVVGDELRDNLFKAAFEDVDFFEADLASKFMIVYNLFSGKHYVNESGSLIEERHEKSKSGASKQVLEEIDDKIENLRKKYSRDINLLKRMVREDRHETIRYLALKELIEYCSLDKENIPFYLGLLNDNDEGMRHYAALALGEHTNVPVVEEIAGDILFKALKDKNKFVRYRILWTIGKLRLPDDPLERHSRISQLFDLLFQEEDKIVANRAFITINKIFLKLPKGDIITSLNKEFSKNPIGTSLFAAKHLSKRIFPNYGPEIETDKIKSLQPTQFESYLRNNKVMTKLLLEWNVLGDSVRKYHLLKASEEFFSMLTRAFINNESTELKKCLGGYLNNLEADVLGVLSSALQDKEDFIRYRSAGVIYRIIKMITRLKGLDISERSNREIDKIIEEGLKKGDLPEMSDRKNKMRTVMYVLGRHIRAEDILRKKTQIECKKLEEAIDFLYVGILDKIFLPLKQAYEVEKVDSVKRKIKESLDLCVFSTHGLTPSDY